MSHKFDRTKTDPYAEAANQLEERLDVSDSGIGADAQEGIYDVLGNAIVSALGDIAAAAFRIGVDDERRLSHLADTINRLSKPILTSYRGEIDPEGPLQALASDPRLEHLAEQPRNKLLSELEKTRQLEKLLLNAKRIPDLVDYAGSLGLHAEDEQMEEGTFLLQQHPAPTAGTPESRTS